MKNIIRSKKYWVLDDDSYGSRKEGLPRNFAGNFILNSIVDGEYPPIQEDWVLDDESYGFRREGLPRKGAKERGKDSLDSFRAMVE